MIKRAWKTAKDWGLLGNIVWAVIVAGISTCLPFIAKLLPFLKTSVTVVVPIYLLLTVPAFLLISFMLLIKIYNNNSNIHGKVFGYYRGAYEITCFPYHGYEYGVYSAKIVRTMEFIITHDGITTIGPYFYYSYEPRSSGGVDEIMRPSARVLVNEKASCAVCDLHISKSGNGETDRDKLKASIYTSVPFKIGDTVKFELQYEVIGQHASCREELNKYLSLPTLKDNYRNREQKKVAAEMFYCFARHSARLSIRVMFPENFPWRHLDNIEDVFVLSIGTRPVAKKAISKIAKITSTATSIEAKFLRGIGIEHGFYIFWMVPTKKELVAAGFASEVENSNNHNMI